MKKPLGQRLTPFFVFEVENINDLLLMSLNYNLTQVNKKAQ